LSRRGNLLKASGNTSASRWTTSHPNQELPKHPRPREPVALTMPAEERSYKKHFLTCQENVWIESDPNRRLLMLPAPSYWNGCCCIRDVL